MRKIILFVIAWAVLSALTVWACADEVPAYNPLLVLAVGVVAPVAVTDKNLPWGHAIELEAFGYADTDLLARFLPKDLFPVAPVISALLALGYRLTENGGFSMNDFGRRKLACDWMGTVGRVGVEIFKF